jgi:hypothetical protein
MTTINDLPQPATQYPFKPDQCVYYMPSPRWKAPWPRIPATVANRCDSLMSVSMPCSTVLKDSKPPIRHWLMTNWYPIEG